MRVFITGGTGFLGSAVVDELLGSGHEVLALARSASSAARLTTAGARPHRGSLDDPDSLRRGVDSCDAVIHTAFDNSSPLAMRRAAGVERAALAAMAEVLRGSDRPLLAAGGFAPVRAAGLVINENDAASPRAGLLGRNVERTIMQLAGTGVNASVVRLPLVHGDGDHFTLPRFITIARRRRHAAMVGEGTNRLPAVHHRDAAGVFCRALDHATPGSRFHAVAEEGVPFGDIAAVIGRRLGVPVVSLGRLRAVREFGAYAPYAGSDAPASGTLTRKRLGWQPVGPSLLTDLDRPEYFAS